MRSAKASVSPTGQRNPPFSSSSNSGIELQSLATTGRAAGHRFQHGHSKAFPDRGHQQDVHLLVAARHFAVRNSANRNQVGTRRQTAFRAQSRGVEDADVRMKAPRDRREPLRPFAKCQIAREQDPNVIFQHGPGGRAESDRCRPRRK